jgi:glyoxylase-like metal-dependent hydrolase (beta-lactamase superfamily II)
MPRPSHRFKVGDLECVAFQIAATTFNISRGFGSVTAEEVTAVTQAEGRDASEYPFLINQLYVQSAEHQFLVDPGSGKPDLDPDGDDLADALGALRIDPAAIDAVIITHAHWDHFAGIHDSSGNLNFPNARYFIGKTEWDICTAKEQLESTNVKDLNPAYVKRILLPLRDRIELIEPDSEFLPGVSALAAPGHTAGQLAILITSNGEGLLHVADVTHHPFQVEHTDWTLGYDPLQAESGQSRQQLVELAARDHLLWFGFHFPSPGLGYVSKDETGFHWQPIQ